MQRFALSILLSAGILCLALPASADPPCGMSMMGRSGMGGGGMGMMGGSGMGGPGMGMMGGGCGMVDGAGMMGLHLFSQLNLTPDQHAKLEKIKLDLRKQHWQLKGKTFDYQASLKDLWNATPLDPKKIGAAYAQLFDIRRQMIESAAEAMNRARDILTKEQVDKLKQLRQERGTDACPMHEEMHEQAMPAQ